jgi:exosortase
VLSARATRGRELALFALAVSPLLVEWFETTSASSRLSYALLVPCLSAALAWRVRGSAPAESPSASTTPLTRPWVGLGAVLALLSAAAFLGGALSGVYTLSLLGLPLAAAAFTARFGGSRALRAYAAPLLLLFALVPPPMPLMDRVNPFLVEASGRAAVALLVPFDAEVVWRGPQFFFRGWTLVVAEACSGSGTFLMLFVLSAFLAGLFRLRPVAGAFLLALSVPVTLLVNALRIASSALVIDRFGAAAGEGLAHELLGQAVVVLGAALLVILVERWSARATRGELSCAS